MMLILFYIFILLIIFFLDEKNGSLTKKMEFIFCFLLLDQKKQKSRTNTNSNSFINFFLVHTLGIHECFAILAQKPSQCHLKNCSSHCSPTPTTLLPTYAVSIRVSRKKNKITVMLFFAIFFQSLCTKRYHKQKQRASG